VPERPSQISARQPHTRIRQRGQEILRKAIEFAGDIGLRVVQVMAYDVFTKQATT
jgi:L-ribulose-5-phosphate 3-epimerase UlaE